MDKRHGPAFGITRFFLWIKGTFLSCYYYAFFVDKMHWPEFGIITCFLWIKRTGLSLV